MICSRNRDSTNTGKNRKSTYFEHYFYWYYCYLIDGVKKEYTCTRQKKHFLNLAIQAIKDKNIHTQVLKQTETCKHKSTYSVEEPFRYW